MKLKQTNKQVSCQTGRFLDTQKANTKACPIARGLYYLNRPYSQENSVKQSAE